MSNSRTKMDVRVTRTKYGKRWALVSLKRGNSFLPSFEDLHRIIQAISYCEDEKYPSGKGRAMVAEFLNAAVYERDFDKLAASFRIPIRCGEKVVKDNGAKLET